MDFKACLLDLDNTIYNYDNAHSPALVATLTWFEKEYGIDLSTAAETYKTARSAINRELRGLAPSHSRLLYFKRMMELLSVKPLSKALHAEELYWNTFLNSMKLTEGVIDFLKALRDRRIPVAIVTDLTAQIQLRKIAHVGIEQFIDAIVTSEESGAEKPSELIFRLALRKLQLDEAEGVFVVGDNIDKDIAGGLSLAMKCFWFIGNQSKQAEPQSVRDGVTAFENFSELTQIICSVTKKAR